MDYKLERKILYNSEPENEPLIGWCLNEIDENGKKIGLNLVPWFFSLYFTASSLRVVRETSIEIKSEDDSNFVSESSQTTVIFGTLYSGYPEDGDTIWHNHNVSFSFMGTKRKISKFSLSISASKEGDKDLCSVVAVPSYEWKVDCINHIEDDYLGFEVSLNNKFFDELVRAIESGSADAVTMRVGFVRGFYSSWSPSISTTFVKVLAPDVRVEGVEDGKFTPPTTNIAKDFNLTIGRVHRLNLQNGFSLKHHETNFLEDKSYSLHEDKSDAVDDKESRSDEYVRNSIALAVKLTNSLKLPLWAIFVVLFLLLLK